MSLEWLYLILAAIVTEAVSQTVEDGGGAEELALLGDKIKAVNETLEDGAETKGTCFAGGQT